MKDLQFPVDEYHTRIERARALMRAARLDALLVGTGSNFTYLSGYPSPAKSTARPFFMIVPLEHEPFVLVQDGRRLEAERYAWVPDIRTYSQLSRVPVDALVDLLRESRIERGRIGIERGHEMLPAYPLWELMEIGERLPGLEFHDASSLLWDLRMVKSPREIDLVRQACLVTSRVYARCLPELHPGMSEVEAARLFAIAHLKEGGEMPRCIVVSDPRDYDLASKPPGARRFASGDFVWFDVGCSVGGYHSDFSRAAVLGRASAAQARAQAIINRATTAGLKCVRHGVPASTVARACDQVIDESGLALTSNISRIGGRIGHGLGLDVLELPSINAHDSTVLRAGMVLTVEPGVATKDGIFHQEQDVLVTEDGCEILSTAPTDIYEISG
jgi:Xaa-Pro dipeptidase